MLEQNLTPACKAILDDRVKSSKFGGANIAAIPEPRFFILATCNTDLINLPGESFDSLSKKNLAWMIVAFDFATMIAFVIFIRIIRHRTERFIM